MTEEGKSNFGQNEPISSLSPVDSELKNIETRHRLLAIEREEFNFLQEKARSAIELEKIQREQNMAAEMSKVQLATIKSNYEIVQDEKAKFYRHQRQLSNRSYWFKMIVSTVLLGSGIWLISKGDNLGPYLLGTGAGGAGIQSAAGLLQNKEGKGSDRLNSDSREKESE